VFAGKRVPMIFGEPDQWMALLLESLLLAGRGQAAQAEELRLRAFDEAPASAGVIDGQPFEWIADADSRLGPVLEAIINGRYYWVPVVWMPAHFQFTNGGESLALLPTRYAGSQRAGDGQVVLARKTVWEEMAPEVHHGLGQRIFSTDADEFPIMDVRTIELAVRAEPDSTQASDA
jgi:type VI secretion system protein ImpE